MKSKFWIVLASIALLGSIYLYFRSVRSNDVLIDPLRNFAIDFEPCDELSESSLIYSETLCKNLQSAPKDVLFVLDHRRIDYEYAKWVLLIYLKVLQRQLVLHNQCFELRESPFLIKRFLDESAFDRALCKIVGESLIEKWAGPEFLCGWDAYRYVTEHSEFIDDEILSRQVGVIDSLQKLRSR